MSNMVIYSTPQPIPQSRMPKRILAAMIAQASSPDAQNLLVTESAVVSGKPARKADILEVIAPEPG